MPPDPEGFLEDCWQSTVVFYAKKPSMRGAKAEVDYYYALTESEWPAGRCGARWMSWLPATRQASSAALRIHLRRARTPRTTSCTFRLITPLLPDGMPN